MPPAVEDWIGPRHPSRFIREFVASIDLEECGFVMPDEVQGGECYHPDFLLAVWLYGYWRKVRSLRKLEEACQNDVGFVWLSGNLKPDHNALWRFWKANKKALRMLFGKTVRVALDLGQVEMITQAIDGTKIEAACGQWGSYTREGHEKIVKELDRMIGKLEQKLAGSALTARANELSEELADKQKLREKVRESLERMKEEEIGHLHPQEPDARRMKADGRPFGYNAQIVADAKSSVVIACDVVNEENDTAQLAPMMEKAKETTSQTARNTLADTGYSTGAQLLKASEQSTSTVLAPLSRTVVPDNPHDYHRTRFTHDKERDVVLCPQGQALAFHHERERSGVTERIYRNAEACAGCPVRSLCTTDRHGRSIEVKPYDDVVAQLRERMKLEENRELSGTRGMIVERPFAHIKAHWDFRRWTVKGLENVKAQWAMICATWNLTRIFKVWKLAPATA